MLFWDICTQTIPALSVIVRRKVGTMALNLNAKYLLTKIFTSIVKWNRAQRIQTWSTLKFKTKSLRSINVFLISTQISRGLKPSINFEFLTNGLASGILQDSPCPHDKVLAWLSVSLSFVCKIVWKSVDEWCDWYWCASCTSRWCLRWTRDNWRMDKAWPLLLPKLLQSSKVPCDRF